MARADGDRHNWNEYERFYNPNRDDDSLPSYRYDKYRRYAPYVSEVKPEDREREKDRRYTVTVLAKFFLFCTAMILFCVLMYIPVYNRANDQIPKAMVAGWSTHTNRDTKIYVQPNNVTTIHEPANVCPKSNKHKRNNIFLLIIVCSSTMNFDKRVAIRDTWGSYKNYLKTSNIFSATREKYKHYNFTYDLYSNSHETKSKIDASNVNNASVPRTKRHISGFGQLLPELAKALQNNLVNVKTEIVPDEEERFEDDEVGDDDTEKMLPEFDMDKELGNGEEDNKEETDYYDYESNIMKIPPKGYEDSPDLHKILNMLKKSKDFPKMEENDVEIGNSEPDFKLVFLLGLPPHDNNTHIRGKIEEEVQKYGDVIQESFIDSYNNLTLKSIMMLKWVTNNCKESVRYILKTDDDMYINVPSLVLNLRNRSKEYDAKVAAGYKEKEYLLIGDLICGARPVLDANNKWFSPRYMYGGRVYPRYLSGTGYALSAPTARALYAAALTTNYFHLEDIYITGMCALRAAPRIPPRDDPSFTYHLADTRDSCYAHSYVTVHRVPPQDMRVFQNRMAMPSFVDKCERMRLTQIKAQQRRLYVLYKYLRLLITDDC